MSDEALLKSIRVARPCPTRWTDMIGDDRVRFCSACSRSVYNFSALTNSEATQLISEKEGNLCGLLYRRLDGTVLTSDCPVGKRRFLARVRRRAIASAASLLVCLGGRFLTANFKARTSARVQSQADKALATQERELLGSLGYIR